MTTQRTFTAPILLPGDPTFSMHAANKNYADSKVPATRNVNAGTGMTGGGALSADVTLTVAYGTTSGTAAQGNDTRITGAEQTTNKAAASGYASLNSSTQVPIAQLPTGTTSSTVAIGNDSRITGAAPAASPTFTGTATFGGALVQTPVTLTDASTIVVNAALGNLFRVTLGASRIMGAPSNPTDGQLLMFAIKQPASGGPYLITWTTAVVYEFGTDVVSPTLSTAANAIDYVGFIYSSSATKWHCLAWARGY